MGEKDLDLLTLQELSSQMGRERWRVLSDAAQVVANYLACHPSVEAVRYPGLKSDPDFPRAANALVGGFGPYVRYRTAEGWHLWEADERDVRDQVMDLEVQMIQKGTDPF